ncbi:MAG: DNA repair protein RadC [Anaerolineae bacterium]
MTTVHDLPADERPVNRLCHVGPAALSTGELIAILLGTPHQLMDAQRLIETFKGLPGIARAAFSELTHQHGIGPATAAKIQAALELGRRLITTSAHKEQIRSPADAAAMLIPEMSLLEREQLRVILLDTKNYLLGAPTVYVGSINTNLVRVAEIFHPAITHYAAAIIIVHNHPSGDPTPSPEDVTVTHKIIKTGQLMDIEVLDHIIIGQGRFVSLKERGLGFQ